MILWFLTPWLYGFWKASIFPCKNNSQNLPSRIIKWMDYSDVAVLKCHQWLDELLIFLPTLYRKSAKLFTRKLSVRNAHIYNKRMLCEHDCIKFRGRIAWHSFLEINFAKFLDEVRLKIKISSSRWWHFVTVTSAIVGASNCSWWRGYCTPNQQKWACFGAQSQIYQHLLKNNTYLRVNCPRN